MTKNLRLRAAPAALAAFALGGCAAYAPVGLMQFKSAHDKSGTSVGAMTRSGAKKADTVHAASSPCPQGDSLFDRPAVRKIIEMAWDSSSASKDTDYANHVEIAFAVYQDTTNGSTFWRRVSHDGTPCQAKLTMQRAIGAAKLLTFAHAHPVPWKHVWPGQCAGPDHTATYDYALGGQWSRSGRASGADWYASQVAAVPAFVIDYDGIYEYDGTNAILRPIARLDDYVMLAGGTYKAFPRWDSGQSCSLP